jgi:ABC-type transporter MlaC component
MNDQTEAKTRDKRVNVKISPQVHHLVVKAARDLEMPVRTYTEAALCFFATRKLDPTGFKEGNTARVLTHLEKGINRVLSYMVTQEKHLLHQLFLELINTRIVCEILLSNLHKLSDLSAEEESKLREYNQQYLSHRKASILQQYEDKQKPS